MEFDAFYRENYTRTERAMALAFRDSGLAEEITQEAFYRTLRRWKRVSKLDRPDAWTMVVALNLGRDDSRRKRRHEAKVPLLLVDDEQDGGEQRIEDRMFVTELLSSVTDRQRQVLVLRFIGQLSVPEIARSIKCAEGTVKSTLHTALEMVTTSAKGTEPCR